jgi:PAS domain S-box-containing protein
MRKDGRRVFIDGVARPLSGSDGMVTGFVKVGQDVTERRATEEALRESEARFQQFGEASSDVLWIRDAETLAYEYLSPAYETVYGLPREEALRGNQVLRWVELIQPEDRERVLDLLRRVRAGENLTETYRVIRPSDGQTRWIRNTDFPLRHADGRVQRIGGLSHDVTEEVENRQRLEVLVNELQHRTRNLIAVVNSIARQTMAHTGPTEAFREEFGHRMAALSRVQGLLSRAQEEPITLHALLRLELDALGAKEGGRVRLDGPWVRIRPTIVQTVALVVHELATNARRYGALSEDRGRLSVEWHLHEVEGERRVFIDWRETDLAPTDAGASVAERGGGYGRRLIERALPRSLEAQTTYDLGETELRCTIDLPLDHAAPAQ